jgi:hypothetical protein
MIPFQEEWWRKRQNKECAAHSQCLHPLHFDEESNIEWAKALETEGVHVVYGLLGLKTHSKIALVFGAIEK